jgi:hypothetical protein
MKNFLINLLRPLDEVLFNYLVRTGGIKPIIGSVIGSVASIGGSLLAGRSQRKAAKRAAGAQRSGILAAEDEYRPISEQLEDVYGELYSPKTQDLILGAERRLMPEYQDLQFQRFDLLQPELMRRQRQFQEAELGLLGDLAPQAREALEDPRLTRMADLSAEEAERLTRFAQQGLTPTQEREAVQSALRGQIGLGRETSASAAAEAAIQRQELEESTQARRAELARAARGTAGILAQAARIDPYTAILGRTPSAYQTSAGLSLGPLAPMTTSPGTAMNIASAEDYRRAQAQLALAGVESAYQTAKGQIQSNMIGSVASGLGSLGSTLATSGLFGGGGTPSPVSQTPATPGYGTVLAPPSGGFQAPGVGFAQGILGTYGGI